MRRKAKYPYPVFNASGVYWRARNGKPPIEKFTPLWIYRYNYDNKSQCWIKHMFYSNMSAGYWKGTVGRIYVTIQTYPVRSYETMLFGGEAQIILESELFYYLSLGANLVWAEAV